MASRSITAVVSAAIALAAFAAPVYAATPADDFCSSSPQEMLAALDGTWTLKQGAGFAFAMGNFRPTQRPDQPGANLPGLGPRANVGGSLAIPLPPHKPQRFKLEFQPEHGISILSGEGQEMTMVASPSGSVQPYADRLERERSDHLFTPGSGCNWQSLPVMVGGKSYILKKSVPGSPNPIYSRIILGPNPADPFRGATRLCIRQDGTVGWIAEARGAGPRGEDILVDRLDMEGVSRTTDCSTPPEILDAHGDMDMTLIIKFQSPNSATGMLMFTGKSGRNRFFAKAPVTMSR